MVLDNPAEGEEIGLLQKSSVMSSPRTRRKESKKNVGGVGMAELPHLDEIEDEEQAHEDDDDTESMFSPFEVENSSSARPLSSTYDTSTWKGRLLTRLYPPDLPPDVQLYLRPNIAILLCYFLVGLLQGLSGSLLNVYPMDIGASEGQQVTLRALLSLPASFKLLFGFLSDTTPLFGYRRKAYMCIGWFLASMSMLILVFNIGMKPLKESPAPSIPFLSLMYLLFSGGFWFADVMADSMVAEKSRLEPPSSRGLLQSECYSARFFALLLGAPSGSLLYSRYGPGPVVFFMAIAPPIVIALPLCWLHEPFSPNVPSPSKQCKEIWATVCKRGVWQPLCFVYVFNVMQVSNGAWRQFLSTTLKFSSNEINALLVGSYVLLYAGITVYKKFMIRWSWRSVYYVTTIMGAVLSLAQVCLINGWTGFIPPFLFALGDDCFAEFVSGIQFLPTTIMMVALCPVGSEGASYAMFTTVSNSAINMSQVLSTSLLSVWDVSKEALERGDVAGLRNLTFLTTGMQLSAVLLVGMLPKTREELADLSKTGGSGGGWERSKIGGAIFLAVTFGSLLYAIIGGVMNIVNPGWQGETR